MDELLGKTIESIEIQAQGQYYLRFYTDDGVFIYETIGECCSETWFYSVSGFEALIGFKITSVETIVYSEEKLLSLDTDGKCRQMFDRIYGFKLTTENGYADIEFRNSSNGYYGGDIRKIDSLPQDVVMTQLYEDYLA